MFVRDKNNQRQEIPRKEETLSSLPKFTTVSLGGAVNNNNESSIHNIPEKCDKICTSETLIWLTERKQRHVY